ncbi:MAG: MFS transporter [Gemmatimonadales bacterium]|nr:MAG: MFS transporter [Gemmatimonadales bacterium]
MNVPRAHPLLVVFTLWLLVFSASSQIMIIAPILPLVGTELGITEALLGTLVSAYSVMVGIFAIISGPFSDRIGRRQILLLGSGLMTLALAAHVLVTGYISFLAVRILAGVAGGVLSGSAVSYVGDYFPYDRRGWATGWVMSGAAFGQIIGIPLGVVLAGAFGFRTPFYIFAASMAATFLLVLLRLPQPDVRRSRDRVTAGGALKEYGTMLRRKEIASAAGAFFLMFLGVSLFVVYLPTWLEREIGATANQIAILFLIGGVANVLVGPQAGRISDRAGRKGIILLSCVGLSVTMALTTVVVGTVTAAYPWFFLIMGLVAMRIGPFSALLTALVRDDRRGSLLSLTVALGQVGFAVGGTLSGLIYASVGFGPTSILAAASVMGMGLVVWVMVPEPGRDLPTDGSLGLSPGADPSTPSGSRLPEEDGSVDDPAR